MMMKLLAYLSMFHFISTTLLSLQPTIQAKKSSDPSGSSFAPRATRSAMPPESEAPAHDLCLNNATRGFRVEYTLVTANSPDCEFSLVDDFPVRVQHRLIHRQRSETSNGADSQPSTVTEWMDPLCTPSVTPDCENNLTSSADNLPVHVAVRSYSLQLPSDVDHINASQRVQLRLVQSDHRGGFCDCWAVSNLRLTLVESSTKLIPLNEVCNTSGGRFDSLSAFLEPYRINQSMVNDLLTCISPPTSTSSSLVGFCRGSASVSRGFVSVEFGAEAQSQCENTAAAVDTGRPTPLMGDQCDSMPHVKVRFSLLLGTINSLSSFDEGVELSFRNLNSSSREWIPLMFFTSEDPTDRDTRINIGNINTSSSQVQIRGYSVHVLYNTGSVDVNLSICGSEIVQSNGIFNHVQFRWLQSTAQTADPDRDSALLDNVEIWSYLTKKYQIFMDDFNNQTSLDDSKWSNAQRATIQQQQLQFGMAAPVFTPMRSGLVGSRWVSTVPLNPNPPPPQLSYTLITAAVATSPLACLSSHPTFTAPPLRLEYRRGNRDGWKTLNYHNVTSGDSLTTTFTTDLDYYSEYFQFRFVQLDHRGGFCDCWAVANLTITYQGYTNMLNETCAETGNIIHSMDNTTYYRYYDIFDNSCEELQRSGVAELCGGSASVPRGFVTHRAYLNNSQSTGDLLSPCDDESVVVDGKEKPFIECNDTELRIEIAFDLDFLTGSEYCNDTVDSFHEGIELSFRSLVRDEEDMTQSDDEWIPLVYFASSLNLSDGNAISVVANGTPINETGGRFMLRGYSVPYIIASRDRHRVTLCSETDLLDYPMEFRWLQTSSISLNGRSTAEDIVMLDNISISLQNSSHSASLFDERFDEDPNSLPSSGLLKKDNVWLLNTSSTVSDCEPMKQGGGALFFYTQPANTSEPQPSTLDAPFARAAMISSRQLVIGPLDPGNVTLEPCPPVITTPPLSTDGIMPTIQGQSAVESETLERIARDPRISGILSLIEDSPELALQVLASVLDDPRGGGGGEGNGSTAADDDDVDLSAAAYLLSRVGTILGNLSVVPTISEAFVSVGDNLLNAGQRRAVMGGTDASDDTAGSTLLQVLERFALNNHDVSHPPPTNNNIVFHVQELLITESGESITPIEEDVAEISIPSEVLANQEDGNPIRMASFLFRNMSGLLPQRLSSNGAENDSDSEGVVFRLASPVISASFQCDTCTTFNLSTPVQVTFKHTEYDTVLLENDRNNSEVKCVFWDFDDTQREDAVLFEGQWSEEGCQVNQDLSTPSMTVCECNHLTNFAILLSARPPTFTLPQALALQVIGYVGVSISLVAMAATVFVFLFQKALRTMRNYIHIQLCVTLAIAQIIFVAGIEPRLGEGHLVGGVPVGCRLVAVLLHYWFLVSFMWMLMEGVVLYVALVRVFIKSHARYIAAFTIASYGLPLLYVGGLTVPLGFARSEEMRKYHSYDYGYEQACYLNPATSFVWSLIAPVILILLANVGFFIMAVVVMCRHQRRQQDKDKAKQVRHWLKASISLTVVMGFTWIIGVLVIEVEELFALAFIFTIFVAFQGVFIFVIFVLLSKQVKESYAKWWKAKVAESDFLSKHFGDKSIAASTLTTRRSAPSISFAKSSTAQESSEAAAGEKFELSQSREDIITNSYIEERPVNDKDEEKPVQDFGTSFNVIFVTRPDSVASWNAMNNADIENGYIKEGSSSDNLVEMELNENRAVPNHYVDSSEFIRYSHDNTQQ